MDLNRKINDFVCLHHYIYLPLPFKVPQGLRCLHPLWMKKEVNVSVMQVFVSGLHRPLKNTHLCDTEASPGPSSVQKQQQQMIRIICKRTRRNIHIHCGICMNVGEQVIDKRVVSHVLSTSWHSRFLVENMIRWCYLSPFSPFVAGRHSANAVRRGRALTKRDSRMMFKNIHCVTHLGFDTGLFLHCAAWHERVQNWNAG